MTKDLTFQEQIEKQLNPEGLKRATAQLENWLQFSGGPCHSKELTSRIVAAYLLGASEAEQPAKADHLFVECIARISAVTPCHVGGPDRCHHRNRDGFLDCDLPRSEHPAKGSSLS